MKELLHDDDVREEGRAEGRKEGRAEGMEKGKNLLFRLIAKMTAGGDGDKIIQLENPQVLEDMQKKYGIVNENSGLQCL